MAAAAPLAVDWPRALAFRLQRQHLARGHAAGSLEQAARDSAGLQAQAMAATELGLLARTEGLRPGGLDRALWQEKRLARSWCMRGTLHVIAAGEAALFMAACRRPNSGFTPSVLKYLKLSAADAEELMRAIGEVLGPGRELTRKQLAAGVETLVGPRYNEHLNSGWGVLLKPAAWQGLLICGPPQGQEVTFVHPERWLGSWDSPDPELARAELVRRYLSAYGPATRADFERWAGMMPPLARPAWSRCQKEMIEVTVEGTRLWALAADASAIAASEPSEEIRLVPNFDSYLLGHADRTPMVAGENAGRIYRSAGWVWATVLKGGRAVGIWSSRRTGGTWRVEVDEFAPLGSEAQREVQEEVERMAALLELTPEVIFRS